METETRQPYDWKTQFVNISYMGKKESWLLFSPPRITSPTFNMAVHNF